MNRATGIIKDFIRNPYGPGGYPRFAILVDGGCLCHKCTKAEIRRVLRATRDNVHDGWEIAAIDTNREDAHLTCEHCYAPIERASDAIHGLDV